MPGFSYYGQIHYYQLTVWICHLFKLEYIVDKIAIVSETEIPANSPRLRKYQPLKGLSKEKKAI